LKIWSSKCFHLQPGPILVWIFFHRGKTVRNNPMFYIREHFHLWYLPMERKKHQRAIISLPNMMVQNLKKKFPASAWMRGTPSALPSTIEKLVKVFGNLIFVVHFWLKYLPIKRKHAKSNHYYPKYEGSKMVKKLPPSTLPSAP
jgi:hypothetical protein